MGSKYAVEIWRVTKTYGSGDAAVIAVNDVTLNIGNNEFFTLLGPSGCGKTSLLRLIAGFEFPAAGDLILDGENITGTPPYKRSINTVFQSYALFPHMTVAENIGFGLKMLDKPKSEIVPRVQEMLRLVRMEALANRPVAKLSGGQQQRVALARALAPSPKVLLLDEPLSALDYKLRKEMQVELKRLQAETGVTFIFVTHDQEEALTMSDRIAVMSGGKLLQVGEPREIYNNPADRFVASFIGEANFLTATVAANDASGVALSLASGATLKGPAAEDLGSGQIVTLMIRPEHIRIAGGPPSPGALAGTVADIAYIGTDTYYRVKLADGASLSVRRQNRPEDEQGFDPGDAVAISLPSSALRYLQE